MPRSWTEPDIDPGLDAPLPDEFEHGQSGCLAFALALVFIGLLIYAVAAYAWQAVGF